VPFVAIPPGNLRAKSCIMKVTYVSHACLLIDTGNSLIATDPWLDGPAFCGQWHVFPKPIQADAVEKASVFLISHPHEDHLHEPTLRRHTHLRPAQSGGRQDVCGLADAVSPPEILCIALSASHV